MKTHKHLFERVCALENLLAASREALRHGKRAKPPGARYFAELEKEAVRLRAELLGGTYRRGAYTSISRMARFAAVGQSGGDGARLRDDPRVQRAAFSKSGRPSSGGPATASSAAKDVAGSAPHSDPRSRLCRSARHRAGFLRREPAGGGADAAWHRPG